MYIVVDDFNLHDTVTCGQIFRFTVEDDNSYTVILSDRVVNLKLEGNKLFIDSSNMDNIESVVRNYFDLDYDYNLVNKKIISIDKDNEKIVSFCKGLKMINEPKLEVIISYILSANNGVPQIRNGLDNISRMFGEKVVFRGDEYYLFPAIDKLKSASITDFRNCKTGFRDKYIYGIVQDIVNGEFDYNLIDNMNSVDALKYLMSYKGIGEKVASCILLFGYHRFDVFPIDTWVKKYMKDKYNLDKVSDIREFMFNKYSDNCGLVIQYVFHFSRNKKNI
ncbi:MAG: DNA-3-methyladenine glycosylase family protein [Bacilli bacterium]